MALRQQIWERDGERTFEVDHSSGDYPRWIDTSVMLADPLTKSMNSDVLGKVMMTGVFDMKPTEESLMIKEKNRKIRKRASEDKKKSKELYAHIWQLKIVKDEDGHEFFEMISEAEEDSFANETSED